jgi:hypothetical protein
MTLSLVRVDDSTKRMKRWWIGWDWGEDAGETGIGPAGGVHVLRSAERAVLREAEVFDSSRIAVAV